VSKTVILGNWVHAHERDSAGGKVYVEVGQPLPPSRGRHRIEFREDGTFVEGQPGADDRTAQASGHYQFDGTRLVLRRGSAAETAVFDATPGGDGKSLLLKKV